MSGTPATPLLGVRVLVVDDDPDTRDIVTMVLEEAGANVKSAPDGNEGLRIALEWQPAVVLADLMMPDADGCSFVRQLRQVPGMEAVPAIAVTGMVSLKAREEALRSGCQDYVAKPLTPDTLVALVARWGVT